MTEINESWWELTRVDESVERKIELLTVEENSDDSWRTLVKVKVSWWSELMKNESDST